MKIEEIRNALRHPDLSGSRRYAVMVPLCERDGRLHVVFEIRSAAISQGGETCFPGGRIEKDETPEEAAVRETSEELLLDPSRIEVLAPVKTGRSSGSREIYAFAGYLKDWHGTFSEAEAERVFLIPLDELLQIQPEVSEITLNMQFADDFPFDLIPDGRAYPFHARSETMYFYRTGEAVIWGLTASVLHSFLETCRTYENAERQ